MHLREGAVGEFAAIDVTDLVDDAGLLTSTDGAQAASRRCAQLFNEFLRRRFSTRTRVETYVWFRIGAYRPKGAAGLVHARITIEYGDRPPADQTGIITAMRGDHYNKPGVRAQAMTQLGMKGLPGRRR